jgi:hypothetical protein
MSNISVPALHQCQPETETSTRTKLSRVATRRRLVVPDRIISRRRRSHVVHSVLILTLQSKHTSIIMAFAETFAKWVIRVIVALLGFFCIQVLAFNGDSWEKQFTSGDLDDEREAIARTGVMFDHGFQSALWLLCILVSELSSEDNVKLMRQVVLAVIAYAMTLNGIFGLKYFYVGCDTYDLCLVGAQGAQILSGVIASFCIVAIGLNCTPTNRSDYSEVR